MRRVVITGMGIWSCLGKNLEEVRQSLYHGKSGIGIDEERIAYGYRSPLTGIVERPALKGLLEKDFITLDKNVYSVYDQFFSLWLVFKGMI